MRLRRPPIPRPKLQRARDLRRGLTMAERRAWNLLRNRRMLGLTFRRQHVIAGFIVDFYCAELRLVLEIDGSGHSGGAQSDYDAARTARSEEHTSELQSPCNLVCRLLLEKKKHLPESLEHH